MTFAGNTARLPVALFARASAVNPRFIAVLSIVSAIVALLQITIGLSSNAIARLDARDANAGRVTDSRESAFLALGAYVMRSMVRRPSHTDFVGAWVSIVVGSVAFQLDVDDMTSAITLLLTAICKDRVP
jgi:hypothetical protein